MKKLLILLMLFSAISFSINAKAETASVEKIKCPFTGSINATALLIRSKPDKKGKIVGSVLDGHRIEVISRTDVKESIADITASWYKIKIPSGKKGYCFGGFIKKAEIVDHIPYGIAEKCPDSIKDYYDRIRYFEKKKLKSAGPKVIRKNHSLILHCSKGRKVIFNDGDMKEEKTHVYSFKKYYKKAGQFLVMATYYESYGLFLVNEKTAKKMSVWGSPVFSPDKSKFICTSVDMEAGYVPNGIQIWEKRGNNYIKKYEKNIEWGAMDPKWTGNNTLQLTRYDRAKDYKLMKFKAELKRKGKRWVLR